MDPERVRACIPRCGRRRRSHLQDVGVLGARARARYSVERRGPRHTLAIEWRAPAIQARCRSRALQGRGGLRVNVLLTGRGGQVGSELQAILHPAVATDHAMLDLANAVAISRTVRDAKPDVIVNAAAYTAVDKAESEPDLAMRVNGIAPGVLAEEAKRLGALLVHYSTDYVFDGSKPSPYGEDDVPNPLNAYGHSKLAGERAVCQADGRHLILRTSWVYGPRGRNFYLTMAARASKGDRLRVVNDQRGIPT